MAAPTLVSYTEVDWTSAVTSQTTASISWNNGDVLAFVGGCEGVSTIALPTTTGTGLSFLSQQVNSTAGTCSTRLAACVATATSSGTINSTSSGAGLVWGFGVWVWRGSQGIGNSSEQHTATKTVNMTPAAGADCGVVWGAFDFSAGASPAATPTPTHTRQAVQIGASYSIVVADIADQISAGAVSYGLTVTGTTGPYSIIVLEIKAGAASGVTGWRTPTAGPSWAI
jgi:hypothetical protein